MVLVATRTRFAVLLALLAVAPRATADGMCRMPDPVVSEEQLNRDTEGMNAEQLTTHTIKVAEAGKLAQALPLFQRVLRLAPSNAQYFSNAGVTYMRLGLYHSAEACFNRGAELCKKQGILGARCSSLGNLGALSAYLPDKLSTKERAVQNVARLSDTRRAMMSSNGFCCFMAAAIYGG